MKISLFVFPAVIITAVFGFFDEYLVMFLALFLHEAGHLFAVKKSYIEISYIKIEPFGIRIALKDEIIKNPADEIKIAAAGPAVSIILAAVFLVLCVYFKDIYYLDYFAYGNLYLGIFNLLPVFPADGGRILRAYLSTKTGYIKSYNAVRKTTLVLSAALVSAGIYILWITGFNFSVCLTGAFLYYGMLTEKNHSSYYLNKELTSYGRKTDEFERMSVFRIAVNENYPVRKILNELTLGRYCIAEVIDGYKKNCEFTEGELMEQMLKKGSDIRIKDIYKHRKI